VTPLEQARRLSDHGNAPRLIDHHGAELRYLPGGRWHVWDGTRWLPDASGETVRKAREVIEHLYAKADEAASRHGDDHKTTKDKLAPTRA
jgi:phage/plasmid-associated DNA primase